MTTKENTICLLKENTCNHCRVVAEIAFATQRHAEDIIRNYECKLKIVGTECGDLSVVGPDNLTCKKFDRYYQR